MEDIDSLYKKLKGDGNKVYKDYWDSVSSKYTDNKNKDIKLNEYLNFDKVKKIKFNKSLNQQRDHGVCGQGRFVKNTMSRQGHDYSKTTTIDGEHYPCHTCDDTQKKLMTKMLIKNS